MILHQWILKSGLLTSRLSCFHSIILSDPKMTLRDSCYLKHMHISSRHHDGKRGGVEKRRGGDPLVSQVLFSCCAHVLCIALLCIFQGPSGHGVYIRTRWCFQLAINCTIWFSWVCVSVRITDHLSNVVGGSLEQEAKENSETEKWCRITERMWVRKSSFVCKGDRGRRGFHLAGGAHTHWVQV